MAWVLVATAVLDLAMGVEVGLSGNPRRGAFLLLMGAFRALAAPRRTRWRAAHAMLVETAAWVTLALAAIAWVWRLV